MDEQPTQSTTHLTPDPVAVTEASPIDDKGRVRRAVRALAVDVTPLKVSRDFRLLFFGQAVTYFGSMMTFVVLPWQVYQLTRSSFAVGMMGVAEFVPILAMAFVGGALADYVDRRRMVRLTELALAVGTGVLIFNSTLEQPRVWVLYVCASLFAAASGLQRPSLEALVPRIVPPELMPSAMALRSLGISVSMIVGPALGGLLAVAIGPVLTYSSDLVTFVASLAALCLMRAVPPPPDADRPSVQTVIEGLRYARSRPELMGTYLVDINAMFFGMPMALFPAVAENFGGASVGLLYAMPAVGSLCVTLTSGWAKRVERHGLAVALAAACWGVAIIGFGFATSLPIALLCLALAGGADMISGLFRSTIWNQTIPDHLRGRLAGIEMVSYTTGPLLGNAEAGLVASLLSVRTSIISGGVMCVVGTGLLALALPAFIRYNGREGLARKRAEEAARVAVLEAG
ncbi:MAG TPA: MFS transporter [Pyrinomonadaceae bacterium]|nr:MFS transporter [Pyrinomonadaceae bacterium]